MITIGPQFTPQRERKLRRGDGGEIPAVEASSGFGGYNDHVDKALTYFPDRSTTYPEHHGFEAGRSITHGNIYAIRRRL